MDGINLEKHFSLNSCNQVKAICDPVLKQIGITYFNYIKIYNKDCSRELLTNNSEWINHFYANALYSSIGAVDVEHLLPKGYFLWSELNTKDPIYLQGRDAFNIDNGITFVIKREEVTLLYIFGANRGNHAINNFYASNVDLLQRFIHYFTDQGQQLLKTAADHRIYLPNQQNINSERVNNIVISDQVRSEFLQKTQVKRYYILNEADDLYLTQKESEVTTLYINGFTAKHIAVQLDLSPRTVEGYLAQIKYKIQDTRYKIRCNVSYQKKKSSIFCVVAT